MSDTFKWRELEFRTIGDLIREMSSWKSPEDATEFMQAYRAWTKYADENIGYLTGYFNSNEMIRLQEWAGVAHPIFGTKTPTAGEALQAGKWMGEKARREEEREPEPPKGAA